MNTISFASGLGPAAWLGLTLGLSLTLLVISIVDGRSLRIPDALSLPLIALGLALSVALPGGSGLSHAIGAAAGFLFFAVIGEAHFRLRGVEGLGLGDAKLFSAAGAWLGWQNLPAVLLVAALGGLAQALLVQHRQPARPLAFGPWIAAGFWLVWIAGSRGGIG
jgi:leader peptidase (prepilin peptidase)/N-methyltransferase